MNAQSQTAGQKAAADVAALLKARSGLIWIVSREEARVERLLVDACEAAQYAPRFWDCSAGLQAYGGAPIGAGAQAADPGAALQAIKDSRERAVYVMRDLPAHLRDIYVSRALRNLARSLPQSKREEARSIIVLSPSAEVPPELAGSAVVVSWPMPDRAEIAEILDAAIAALPESRRATATPNNGQRDACIDAAAGLTAEEATSAYAKSLVQLGRIDAGAVAQEKKRLVALGGLSWIDPNPAGLDAVGGLDNLKAWLRKKRSAFGAKARAYGLPAPRGCILTGVPGCGKSLSAKALGTAWEMPILRWEPQSSESKWQGETAQNTQRVFQIAEAVAPCILMIDEGEKGFAGSQQSATDGGTKAGTLGAVLTWLQESKKPVFVVMTANNVSSLPAEFLRAGRFDAVWFVDLPQPAERAAILRAVLREYRRDVAGLDVAAIAAATDGFSGAEIAAAVLEAMTAAFDDGAREITTADVIDAARQVVPLSRTSAETIARMREWAKGRARYATTPETVNQGAGSGRALDLE